MSGNGGNVEVRSKVMRNYGIQGTGIIKLRFTMTVKLIINLVLCNKYTEMIFAVVPCILM